MIDMRSHVLLPPGDSLCIQWNPDPESTGVGDAVSATVSAYRGDRWLGEVSVAPSLIEQPDELQRIADMLTKRGVRA